jgi:hypothetical protein
MRGIGFSLSSFAFYQRIWGKKVVKFIKKKISALSGETEVLFELSEQKDNQDGDPWRVVGSLQGVTFRGNAPFIADNEDLQDFAKVMSLAWTEHRKLMEAKIHVSDMM